VAAAGMGFYKGGRKPAAYKVSDICAELATGNAG